MAFLRKINRQYYAYFTDSLRQPKQKSVALGTGLKSAAILGHASITTTEIYSHLLPDTMQAAVQQTFGGR